MNPFFHQTSVAQPRGWMPISHITLTWKPNNESGLAGYNIYKRILPSTDYGRPILSGIPSNPSAPQLTVPNLLEGTSYGFIVTAFDSAGNENAPSLEKQTTVAAPETRSPSATEEPLHPVKTANESPPGEEEQTSVTTEGNESTSDTEEENTHSKEKQVTLESS